MDKDLINTPGRDQEQESGYTENQGRMAPVSGRHTRVENAHAAGVGAMGRNDEKLSSGEEGEEVQDDGPAY